MIPSHHPHAETLVSYACGTLPSAVACIVGCHLSMCTDCAQQIRWLEKLGGVLLSNLETDDAELPPTGRIVGQRPIQRQSRGRGHKTMTTIGHPLLSRPLLRYLDMSGAETSWTPVGSGIQERSIELPKHSGSIKLLRLSPGKLLPEHNVTLETEVALVLQGACRDSAGTYVRGDLIEWTEDSRRRPMASGEAECVCLIADPAIG